MSQFCATDCTAIIYLFKMSNLKLHSGCRSEVISRFDSNESHLKSSCVTFCVPPTEHAEKLMISRIAVHGQEIICVIVIIQLAIKNNVF